MKKIDAWRCRSCFEGVGLKDIFEVRIDNFILWEVIRYCTNGEISCCNELPSKLCALCFGKWEDTYAFIKEFKQTQKRFINPEATLSNDYDTKIDIEEDFKNFLNDYENGTEISPSNDDKTVIEDQFNQCLTSAGLIKDSGNDALEEISVKPEINNEFLMEENLHKTEIIEISNETSSVIKEEIQDKDESIHEVSVKKTEPPPTSEVDSNSYCEIYPVTPNISDGSLENFPTHFILGNPRKEPNTQCFECLTVFPTGADLKRHSKETGHDIAPRYKCEICGKHFKFRNLFKNHLRKHETPLEDSVCEICGACVRTSSLQRHMQRHGSGNKCPDCGKNFTQKEYLIKHMKKHRLMGNTRKELCHICGVQKTTLSTLNQHMNKKHGGASQWSHQCEICKLSFFSKFSLSLHVQKMHTQSSVCKKTSKRILFCKKVKRSVADNEGVEVETEEGTKEKSKKTVKRIAPPIDGKEVEGGSLELSKEDPKKIVQCSECLKPIGANYLYQHMLIHKNLKPHQCEVCSKTFRLSNHLKSHMNIHLDLKPFECKYCKKCFRHQTTLRIHTRSHTGEMPYVCRFCSKGFAHSSSMKKHEETHSKKGQSLKKLA